MKAKTRYILSITVCIAIALFVAIAAVCACAVGGGEAYAESVYIDGYGDEFELEETEYAADESRMFSATVNFIDGDVAGLVFGAEDLEHYWSFDVDRGLNEVKLTYFYYTDGRLDEEVLESEYYVGPSNMNEGELSYVTSRTASLEQVYLKAVITPEDDGVYAEFYADGIRRFVFTDGSAEARTIKLGDYEIGGEKAVYGGGSFGFHAYDTEVRFTDILSGASDFSYYSELYRNQYHFSQFAHWNNDPNGLVYYNGYYHIYYQHNPYGNTWDAMHWGHARSRDLVHWEMLPIALVPDYDLDETLGFMWSGSVMPYRKGDSATIDNDENYKWFDETGKNDGDVVGLIGFYTRHDDADFGGNRYQVVMYSNDGGLTWNKRDAVHRTTSKLPDGYTLGCNADGEPWGPDVRPSWRDPKVFDISGLPGISDGYKWGMALTGMEDQMLYFLKSKDLVKWEHGGSYKVECRPECPDVLNIDGHAVITLTSRYYFVCDLSYSDGAIVMTDLAGNKINELLTGDARLKRMEYGYDSYAAQSFNIDANSDSAYAGKAVGLSWFSGVPGDPLVIDSGALATARKVWNGGGMTIPVIYGLSGEGLDTVLTETPIVKDDAEFAKIKTNVVDKKSLAVGASSDNPLADVNSHTIELIATVSNPDKASVSVKVNERVDSQGNHYYTEIGWNATDGYFVSREHTENGGLALGNYARRYATGLGKDATELSFYILADNNCVEVFCDDYRLPFYVLTFASPYSTGASMTTDGDVIADITVNVLSTTWRKPTSEIMINLSAIELDLGDELTVEKEITAFAEGSTLEWEVVGAVPDEEVGEGEDGTVVLVDATETGAVVRALRSGTAQIKVSAGSTYRIIDVYVHTGELEGDFTFDTSGVVSGDWYFTEDGLVGTQLSGDGFLLSEQTGGDFVYAADFDLGDGAAAALVFRATANGRGGLSSYIIANYDHYGKVVKLWSQNGDIAKANVISGNIRELTLAVKAQGNKVQVVFNGKRVIDATIRDNDPLEGKYGLNACATSATFTSLTVHKSEQVYEGEDDMELVSNIDQHVLSVTNNTAGNTLVQPDFYYADGKTLTVYEEYFALLPRAGKFTFTVEGSALSLRYVIDVKGVPETVIESTTVEQHGNAVVYIGNTKVEYVKVNRCAIASAKYEVHDYLLTIDASALTVGNNDIEIAPDKTFTVTVTPRKSETVEVYQPPFVPDYKPFGIAFGTVCGVIILAVIIFIVLFVLYKNGKVRLPETDKPKKTAAVKRRDAGLIGGALIDLPILLLLIVCMVALPGGFTGSLVWLIVAAVFGYPFFAQLFWNGKVRRITLTVTRSMGTPKEIFNVDKSGNKFKAALRYIGAAFKVLWEGIAIAVSAIVALIRAPFMFKSQIHGVMYGEFGDSNEAEESGADEAVPSAE